MKVTKNMRGIGMLKTGSVACGVALFLAGLPLQAGLIVSGGSVIALAGSTGNAIEVNLTNTGPATLTIGGFSLQVSVAGTAVTFDAVSDATTTPYVFAGHSLFGPDIATSVNGQMAAASDLFDVAFSGATIGVGGTLGLANIGFSVAPLTPPGTFAVTISAFPDTTISDAQGTNLGIQSLTAGQITIPGQANVPEPGTLAETCGAVLALAAFSWPGRKRIREGSSCGNKV